MNSSTAPKPQGHLWPRSYQPFREEEESAPGTACFPSRACDSRDPWLGVSDRCSPRPSRRNPARFLAQEVHTGSKQTGEACRAFLFHPVKDIYGKSAEMSEPKPAMIWLEKSSWLFKPSSSSSCWKPSKHGEVPAASQHFTPLANANFSLGFSWGRVLPNKQRHQQQPTGTRDSRADCAGFSIWLSPSAGRGSPRRWRVRDHISSQSCFREFCYR